MSWRASEAVSNAARKHSSEAQGAFLRAGTPRKTRRMYTLSVRNERAANEVIL